jgi:hypothetical protein
MLLLALAVRMMMMKGLKSLSRRSCATWQWLLSRIKTTGNLCSFWTRLGKLSKNLEFSILLAEIKNNKRFMKRLSEI